MLFGVTPSSLPVIGFIGSAVLRTGVRFSGGDEPYGLFLSYPAHTRTTASLTSLQSPIIELALAYSGAVARRAEDHSRDPVVAVNADEDVTAEAFKAWLDQLQVGEPLHLGVTAADTLAQARAAGKV